MSKRIYKYMYVISLYVCIVDSCIACELLAMVLRSIDDDEHSPSYVHMHTVCILGCVTKCVNQ